MTSDGQQSLFGSDKPTQAKNENGSYQKGFDKNIHLSINQVEYSTGADGPIIHIFGRTESGEFKEIQV
ncbi:hypothetical protein, partial [Methanospirillum sp.]|uniref:hypothetical protein n=1 Tax=Methanospirillum sp. TaxID=45200 RepID=UPI001BD5115A